MADTKIVNVKEIQEHAAYSWAVKEQRKMGIISKVVKLGFKADDYAIGGDNCCIKHGFIVKKDCIISLFTCKNRRAILRADWPKQGITEYYKLSNYDEACKTAPKSIRSMKKNALHLAKTFDLNGGKYCCGDW